MKKILPVLFIILGIGILLYPSVSNYYNSHVQERAISKYLDEAENNSTLNLAGGIMGYIEIPKISVRLPIYHGTSDEVLRAGIGHLDWSSLPVGGKGEHCVLSGHRGYPSARLFTNLVELGIGDEFVIHALGKKLTYRVDQILTVLPNDISELKPVAGHDYCTLVTCTPYGINTHRLLVRGSRAEDS